MRILFLNPGAQMGGAETSLLGLFKGVRAAYPSWSLHLLCGEEGPLLTQARHLGVQTTVLPLPRSLAETGDSGLAAGTPLRRLAALPQLTRATLAAANYGWQLRRLTQALRPALIHATGLKMQILAAAFLHRQSVLVWHIHDYVSWRPLAGRALRRLAGRCQGALVNSHSVAADLRTVCPTLRLIETLYNAVDAAALAAEGPLDLDALAGLPPAPATALRLGLVATYATWKGHLTFLDALQTLDTPQPWRAYLIGGPIYRTGNSQYSAAQLQSEIVRRNLEGKVGLTGFLPGRGAIMRSLDIVVHASTKPEPFGMIVIEAMACGRPVIVSRAGGAQEIFQDGETGLGHTPGDPSSLRAAIQRLLQEPALRQKLSAQGARFATEAFDCQRLARQLGAFYQRLTPEARA